MSSGVNWFAAEALVSAQATLGLIWIHGSLGAWASLRGWGKAAPVRVTPQVRGSCVAHRP